MIAVIRQLEELAAAGRHGAALEGVQHLCRQVLSDLGTIGRIRGSHHLDGICRHIAAAWSPQPGRSGVTAGFRTVVVVSDLYGNGGHSRLVEDLLTLRGPGGCLVLCTNSANGPPQDLQWFAARTGATLRVSAQTAPQAKAGWLAQALSDAPPDTDIFLLSHHDDAAAIVGCLAARHPRTTYIHHADHQLALGATVREFRHIDFFAPMYQDCRHELGVENELWCLPVPDVTTRPLRSRRTEEVNTCTCGSISKFDAPYPFGYGQAVATVLRASRGTHTHIGPIDPQQLSRVRQFLGQQGLDPARLVHVPRAGSLAGHLCENDIDLFLSPFPIGGGRAVIEALSAEVAVVAHASLISRMVSAPELLYPGCLGWSSLPDLTDLLERLRGDPDLRADHARRGRAVFEARHQYRQFEQVLAGAPWQEVYGASLSALMPAARDQFLLYAHLRKLSVPQAAVSGSR